MLTDWSYRLVDEPDEINAAGFIDLFRIWEARRGAADQAALADLDEPVLADWSGRLFSVDVAQPVPHFKRIGANLVDLFGADLSGRAIDQESVGVGARRMAFMYAEVRSTGKVALASGLRVGPAVGVQVYSVIHLPLQEPKGKIRLVLGGLILGTVVVAGGSGC
ncbi:MAG: PAS domain-containing protein [Alphaproteobacteria bacterium]|nr:PAS domain-containing protein [Alphaproteobacteria bacterium]